MISRLPAQTRSKFHSRNRIYAKSQNKCKQQRNKLGLNCAKFRSQVQAKKFLKIVRFSVEVLQWDQCTRDNSEASNNSSKNKF